MLELHSTMCLYNIWKMETFLAGKNFMEKSYPEMVFPLCFVVSTAM